MKTKQICIENAYLHLAKSIHYGNHMMETNDWHVRYHVPRLRSPSQAAL